MNRKRITTMALLYAVFGVACIFAQATRHAGPNPGRTPYHPLQGGGNFFDFSTNKINPCGIDYGKLIDQDREIAIEETIENLLFWSNLFALIVVVGFSGLLYLQWQELTQGEIIVSECLAFYHNQLVDAEEQLDQATHRYERLKQNVDEEAERTLQTKVGQQESSGQAVPGTNASTQLAPAEAKTMTEEIKKLRLQNAQKDVIIESLKQQLQRKS